MSAGVCGLRLTGLSASSVPTSDVSSPSTLYLTPFESGIIVLYYQGSWIHGRTSEASLALSGMTAGKNYDVFAYWTGSAVALELSAAWTNDTTRATALTRQDGIVVKSGDATRHFVGTIRATGATTTNDTVTQRFISNMYNRVPRRLYVHDSTDSWTYTTAAWRQVRANSANQVEALLCDATTVDLMALQIAYAPTTTLYWHNTGYPPGIGVDSTSSPSSSVLASGNLSAVPAIGLCRYLDTPAIGYHYFAWLEYGQNTYGASTFFGDAGVTGYRAGLSGTVII